MIRREQRYCPNFLLQYTQPNLHDGSTPKLDSPVLEVNIDSLTITPEIVLKNLHGLIPIKSPGVDEIHPKVLKELENELCNPLSFIYENSLKNGKLPTQWKVCTIPAIYKKGKKNCPGNYRPVSLTSVPRKIMESIIRDAIINHVKRYNLFSNKQFGFVR